MAENGSLSLDPETTFPGFATAALHAGQEPEQWASNAVVPLISLSTTYKQNAPGKLAAVSLTIFTPYFLLVFVTILCSLCSSF